MKYENLKRKYQIKEQFITVDKRKNIKVFVRIVSDKKKTKNEIPLFVIPGGPGGDASFYFDHIPFLIKFAPVVLFDPRGTGKSDKKHSETFHMENHIKDIEILRKKLEFTKINIFGTSYGGMVAQGYSLQYQRHIQKLILGVTACSHHFIKKAEENIKKWSKTNEEKIYALDILNGRITDDSHFQKVFQHLNPLYSTKVRNNPELAKKFADFKPGNFSYLSLNKGFSGFLRKFDYVKKLKHIKVPTLIFSGKYDWICDVSFGYILNQEIPNSQLCVLPGGHNLFLDCPVTYRHIIKNFLEVGSD